MQHKQDQQPSGCFLSPKHPQESLYFTAFQPSRTSLQGSAQPICNTNCFWKDLLKIAQKLPIPFVKPPGRGGSGTVLVSCILGRPHGSSCLGHRTSAERAIPPVPPAAVSLMWLQHRLQAMWEGPARLSHRCRARCCSP